MREDRVQVGKPFLERKLEPVEVLDEEGLKQIEANAEIILSEIGIAFQDFPEALDLWRAAGAEVQGELVKFPPGLCRSLVQNSAPAEFTQTARNPSRSVHIGGKSTVFAPNYGSPFITDLDNGRRYATLEDFENVVKLTYQLPYLHHSGGTVVEPVDIAVNKRHLDMVYSHLKYSDKPLMGSVTAPERAVDSIELCRLAFGGDLEDRTVLTNLINASSPLRWDATMLGAAKVYAEHNQACIISPFILAGAMSPVTVAGLAAQALAEALSGMAFCQLVRPGAPPPQRRHRHPRRLAVLAVCAVRSHRHGLGGQLRVALLRPIRNRNLRGCFLFPPDELLLPFRWVQLPQAGHRPVLGFALPLRLVRRHLRDGDRRLDPRGGVGPVPLGLAGVEQGPLLVGGGDGLGRAEHDPRGLLYLRIRPRLGPHS